MGSWISLVFGVLEAVGKLGFRMNYALTGSSVDVPEK